MFNSGLDKKERKHVLCEGKEYLFTYKFVVYYNAMRIKVDKQVKSIAHSAALLCN